MTAEATRRGSEVVDLSLRSGEHYESVATAHLASDSFDGGTAHFIQAGGIEMARLIATERRKNDAPLSSYLKYGARLEERSELRRASFRRVGDEFEWSGR